MEVRNFILGGKHGFEITNGSSEPAVVDIECKDNGSERWFDIRYILDPGKNKRIQLSSLAKKILEQQDPSFSDSRSLEERKESETIAIIKEADEETGYLQVELPHYSLSYLEKKEKIVSLSSLLEITNISCSEENYSFIHVNRSNMHQLYIGKSKAYMYNPKVWLSIPEDGIIRLGKKKMALSFNRLLIRSQEEIIKHEPLTCCFSKIPYLYAHLLTTKLLGKNSIEALIGPSKVLEEAFGYKPGSDRPILLPQNFHQIYFGCDSTCETASSLPKVFEPFLKKWSKKLKEDDQLGGKWNHMLWTSKEMWNKSEHFERFRSFCRVYEIEVMDLSETFADNPVWKKLYPTIARSLERKNWGLASDIVRYLLLLEKGGIYADLDTEAIRHFDQTELMNTDFLAGIEEKSNYILLGNAVLGSKKGSLIMKKMVDALVVLNEKDLLDHELCYEYAFATLYATGPILLTAVAAKYIDRTVYPRIYPNDIFYPKVYHSVHNKRCKSYVKPCTVTRHIMTNTWFKKAGYFPTDPNAEDYLKNWCDTLHEMFE